MTHIFFAKYQRALIPYFKEYLLKDQKIPWEVKRKCKDNVPESKVLKEWSQLSNLQQSQLKQYLLQVFSKANTDKMDKRILKNLSKDE